MRVKYIKYGKRLQGHDGESDYFEASVEVGPTDDPADCARKAKAFVREQIREAEDTPLKASLGDRLSASQGR